MEEYNMDVKDNDQIDLFDEEEEMKKSKDDSEDSNKDKGKEDVDPRNKLNELTGSEWLPETKSFFFQKGLGSDHPHAQIEREHPAPFSFQDVQRLVEFFTKEDNVVLDPFSGVGSTAKACALSGRYCVGVELSEQWHDLAQKRLRVEVSEEAEDEQTLICDDCRNYLSNTEDNTFDFMVTSPPYWSILNKEPDHKAMERVEEGLATSYSEDEKDLGNIDDYDNFVDEVVNVFSECGRVLKTDKYMSIIVSDFRHESRFYTLHSDLIQKLDGIKVSDNHKIHIQGVKALLQNQKSLKPYGYPFAYVENIHHQYILIFRKNEI